jgi:hypothetical protein
MSRPETSLLSGNFSLPADIADVDLARSRLLARKFSTRPTVPRDDYVRILCRTDRSQAADPETISDNHST